MRLPVQIFHNDKVYGEVEIKKPKASVIADVSSSINTGKIFQGMVTFLKGCISEIKHNDVAITDPIGIKSLVPKIPYRSAEYLTMQILLDQSKKNDAVEGIYPCPLCGHRVISKLQKYDGMEVDTRDYISSLRVNYKDDINSTFKISLNTPVVIKDERNGEVLENVHGIEFYYPTLEHCINAETKYGSSNDVKLQFGIYAQCIKSINDEPVDTKYRNMFGYMIIENIEDLENDFRAISFENSQYGLDPTIEKTCPECNEVWRPKINTSNFFVSALRLN